MGQLRSVPWREIRKQRHAIIVSNDAANQFLGFGSRLCPSQRMWSGYIPARHLHSPSGGKRVKAIADQITTVSKRRLAHRKGSSLPGTCRGLPGRSPSIWIFEARAGSTGLTVRFVR